jgi:hypothetical protein
VNGRDALRAKGGWTIMGDMSDDLILICNVSSAKYRFVDKKWKNPIDEEFDDAFRMQNGVAWVKKFWPTENGKPLEARWSLINTAGKHVFTLPKDGYIVDKVFNSGVCRVNLDPGDPNGIKYLNREGQIILKDLKLSGKPTRFVGGFTISNNGVMNLKGEFTLKPEQGYRLIGSEVTEGVVIASKETNYYIIAAATGQVLATFPFKCKPAPEGSQCGLIRFTDASDPKKYGFVNRSGMIVIEPQFVLANPFTNGYAHIRMNDFKTNAVINDHGDVIYKEKTPRKNK